MGQAFWWAVSASLALSFGTAPALAQHAEIERAEFLPSTPWNIDYADESCALARRFTDGERDVWFELRGVAPVDRVRLTVGTDRLGTTQDDPHISIYPGREPLTPPARFIEGQGDIANAFVTTVSLNSFRIRGNPPAAEGPQRDDDEELRVDRPAVAGVQIAGAFDETVVLQTGAMEAALNALDACMADLVSTWGIDHAALADVAIRPSPRDREEWEPMVQRHYPRTGHRPSRNTSFSIVLLIDPEGRVARCVSPNALGDEDFLQVACAALSQYATFDPARTMDGRPTYGFWSTGMVYGVY